MTMPTPTRLPAPRSELASIARPVRKFVAFLSHDWGVDDAEMRRRIGDDELRAMRSEVDRFGSEVDRECVRYVLGHNKPTLILGGGGYTIRNVSRCWTFETSVILGEELSDDLPYNDYYEYYGPDFNLHITPSNMENKNSDKYLEKQKTVLFIK